ncbi:hypothetical protein PSTG_12111 [Puccinia striiformis f. sp. tritici PST-78]|uniref:CCHC-type domain-containing protein n=1 Tax=Puccinia striiformis f. sp. tritici PST-78 TaxID=1165861 RepID=A0A0L0V5I8_9BASI|nr:hypothetical protein PSTG_12111 [Puccinia striiformis f. sp. tritici PST-78]
MWGCRASPGQNSFSMKSQQVIKDSPPSSELSDVSLATIKVAEKAKIKKAKEGNHVTANEWTPIATTSASKKKKKAAEKKKTVETFLANSDDGMSKLASPILPDKGLFSALRESLPSLDPAQMNGREPNTGVTPMEVNSRATFLALRSGMSTPVPLPVDRLTVPPTDLLLTESREATTGPETTHPSNQAPAVDNKQLEMYINMFHSQWFMYDEAKKVDDRVVMKAALNQAISSQELILFPEKRASNSLTTSATQASTSTPSHQTGRSSPQEDVAMTYRDPTPMQATAQPASLISSAHQSTHNSAYAPVQSQGQNHAQQAVQYAMNASNYVNQNVPQTVASKLVPNYAPNFVQNATNAPAQNLVPNTTNAPVPNFVPNYTTQFQQNHNPSSFEHPRPPQHQQGLPATSHQAGPTSNRRPNHRARRDRFHYNRNEPAAPQPHPPPQQRATPYPVQHQPGGNLGGSRRRRRNHQPEDNTAQVLEESPKSTSSPVDPYMNLSFNPALEQLSDASQKEFLLSNINNRLVHDNPFLIEDKLQKLFSIFLSDLSGTIDAFPSTLLESCVEKLSSTINSSILELIKSEITPMLINSISNHLRGSGGEKNSSLDICQTEPLKDLINEKIDCLQDIININDGKQKTDMDIMRREMSEMEHRLFNNFSSITNQINDLNNNENNRFEQVKRRLGDANSQIENLNSEVHLLTGKVHSMDRELPPHLKYNNPIMNSPQQLSNPVECSQSSQTARIEDKQQVVIQTQPTSNAQGTEAAVEVFEEFPLINHHKVDLDMRRELWKERAANRSFEASTKLCSKLRAERDERSSSEPRAKHDERPSAELRAELYDTVSAKPQPVFVRAPQTPSTPAGLTRYFTPSGPHLQQTSEPSCSKGQVSLQPQRTSSTPASSSSAAARYPLPCSTPARWKLGGIQEEKEESPTGRQHGPSLGGGQRLLESRKDLRENAKSPGKSECSKQESPKSTSSPVDPYMNLSFNPALEQLSDASQKEFLLSNINNRLVHDNPFLIEDKLQKLFSIFLSDLSGTIDAFPSTLLESCVEKLSSTINSSILELIKSEITPMLINSISNHLRGSGGEKNSSLDICQTEPLKDLINEKIDCLQDIININDGKQKTDMDIMRREMSEMEHRLFNNFSSITNQINDLNNNENNRFEQVKRRLGDANSQIENLNSEVHLLTGKVHSMDRELPPHLKYNNPIMNSPQQLSNPVECSQSSQTARIEDKQQVVIQTQPTSNAQGTEAAVEVFEEFPLINHHKVDLDMRRELWKGIPRTNEWEKFSGEYPYNHELWLKNTDVLVEDYLLLDHMVLSRMTTILTDSAKSWYLGLRDKNKDKSWAWWKNQFRIQWGTENWKSKMQHEFETDHYSYDNKKIHKWFSNQRERLRSCQPELSEYLVCEKVMRQCPGNLEHAIKSRCKKESTQMSYEEMVVIAHDILERAMKPNRHNPPSNNQANMRSSWKNNNSSNRADYNKSDAEKKQADSSKPAKPKTNPCHFCGQDGHFSRECPKKRNRINNVGMEEEDGDQPEKDDEESSGQQSENDEPSKQDDTFETLP